MRPSRYFTFVLPWVVLISAGTGYSAELKKVSIENPEAAGVVLVGRLGEPLGEPVKVEGVVIEGPDKGYEGGPNLRVTKINGRATQKYIRIRLNPEERYMSRDSSTISDETKPFKPQITPGVRYEIVGYESGGYVSGSWDILNAGSPAQTLRHGFVGQFTFFDTLPLKGPACCPGDFAHEEAIMQGKAVTKKGHRYLDGEGWSIYMGDDEFNAEPWTPEFEGKAMEIRAKYWRDTALGENVFRHIGGDGSLYRLEDIIGREVWLRGRARSMNDHWWFHYRGVDVAVPGMEKLPGWTQQENHWRAMTLHGRLEKTSMRAPSDYSEDGPVGKHYVLRDVTWTPLVEDELIGPEVPDSVY